MRFVHVAGTTRTAEIDGISAAGADPSVMARTPSAGAEAERAGVSTAAGRERIEVVYDRITEVETPEVEP